MSSKSPKKLTPCSFLLPLALNDGTPVDEERQEQLLEKIFVEFGGWNIDGRQKGAYRREDTGEKQVEEMLKVKVAVDGPKAIERLKQLVIEIGGELVQESMYFEVSTGSSVELLPSQKKGAR
jgi:hypothetical protein